jgi:hypothetical protein
MLARSGRRVVSTKRHSIFDIEKRAGHEQRHPAIRRQSRARSGHEAFADSSRSEDDREHDLAPLSIGSAFMGAMCWYLFMGAPGQPPRTDLELLRPFPVPISELKQFLGISEWFRKEGEHLKVDRASVTVLRPGEAIVAPAGIEIPPFMVEFLPETIN